MRGVASRIAGILQSDRRLDGHHAGRARGEGAFAARKLVGALGPCREGQRGEAERGLAEADRRARRTTRPCRGCGDAWFGPRSDRHEKSPVEMRVASQWAPQGYLTLEPTLVADKHSDLLRGLIWTTSVLDDPEVIKAVGDAAERCFKKVPGHGPRAPKIGNACLWVLSSSRSAEAVGQLTRVKTRVKHASSRQQVDKALTNAAERAGLSTADLEDIAVPTCGLTELGALQQNLGDYVAELVVTDCRSTELRWKKKDGKPQTSVPAVIKTDFADELKRLKKTDKELGGKCFSPSVTASSACC